MSSVTFFVGKKTRLYMEVGSDQIERGAALRVSHLFLDCIQSRMAASTDLDRKFGWEKKGLEFNGVWPIGFVLVLCVIAPLAFRWWIGRVGQYSVGISRRESGESGGI
jgi:hypothetical protein